MNTMPNNARIARIVPYWHKLENLSKDDKISLIALLSSSLVEEEKSANTTDEGMNRLIKKCFGAWKGKETAEEIIANINESKCSNAEPVKF